jgi:hypothetical protein
MQPTSEISSTLATLFRERRYLPSLLLLAFGLLLFGNSLGNGYSIDDHFVIENNELTARGIGAIPEILTTNFVYHEDEGASFRPIPRISFALEYELFGSNPHVGHFVSLMLHCLVAIAVMILMQSMFPAANRLFPLTVGLLFLAHPIHTEVVANVKNRDELMASLFGLLSLIGFLRYYRYGETTFLVLGTTSFLFSLLSKETAHQFLGVIPLVLFFAEGWDTRRMGTALACALGAIFVFWSYVLVVLDQARALYVAGSEGFNFLEHPLMFIEDFGIRYGTALYSMGYYLRLLLFPHPLSFFYGYGAIPLVGLDNGWAILSLCFYTGMTAFALLRLRTRSIPIFAILYFLGTLAVFSNLLVPMQGIVAERHIYAASLGFCILLGWLLTSIPAWTRGGARVGRVAATAGLVLILALYGLKTFDRSRDWETHFTVTEKDVETFGDSAIIRALLFQLYYERAQRSGDGQARRQAMEKAISHLKEVPRISPPYGARVNLLAGFFQLHLLDSPRDAVASFQDALEAADLDVPFPEPELRVEKWLIRLRLADAHLRLDEAEEARAQLRRSIAAYNAGHTEPIPEAQLEGLSLAESIAFLSELLAPH